ncbi:MAG: sugar ABC transporter substrate-binding protein [Selenomonadaceae bacterium]|nr:sugar ABC transporter substrate-binding protein [Selenomonadaceae bacterium]
MNAKKSMLIASLFAASLFVTGCGDSASSNKVFYASHTEATAFVGSVLKGVESRESSKGVEIEFVNSNRDANLQVDQLLSAISNKPAAIVLIPVDADALIPAVEKANEAGIPVIATNRDLNGGKFAMVKSDDKQAGMLQGEFMAKNLPPNANVVYLMGESTQGSARERFEGFKEACLDKRKDITLLAKVDANWSEAEALKYMTLWMSMFPKIDGVIGGNDTMALGAMKALLAAGRTGVLISGVDAKGEAVEAIKAGKMSHSAKQNADKLSEEIAKLIETARSTGEVPAGEVRVPFTPVTAETLK